jgi:hypothetical protein
VCRVAAAITQQQQIGQRSATPRWSITRRLKGDRSLRSPWEWLIVPERGYRANVTKLRSGTRAPCSSEPRPGLSHLARRNHETPAIPMVQDGRGFERLGLAARSPLHGRQGSRRRPSASIRDLKSLPPLGRGDIHDAVRKCLVSERPYSWFPHGRTFAPDSVRICLRLRCRRIGTRAGRPRAIISGTVVIRHSQPAVARTPAARPSDRRNESADVCRRGDQ